MRKMFFYLYENKSADQLHSNYEADQHLFSIPIFYIHAYPNFKLLLYRPVCIRPGQNPEDRFSRFAAQRIMNQ